MRHVLVIALTCAACGRSSKPHATGRLVFDTKPANEAGVFLATEAEVLRSSPILSRVKEQWRTGDIDPSSISVSRHPDTMILDVTVTDKDPMAAAETCNRVMQTYMDYRLSITTAEIQTRMQVIAEKLDAAPDNADLKRQLDELDTQAHAWRRDVRVLEPCAVKTRR